MPTQDVYRTRSAHTPIIVAGLAIALVAAVMVYLLLSGADLKSLTVIVPIGLVVAGVLGFVLSLPSDVFTLDIDGITQRGIFHKGRKLEFGRVTGVFTIPDGAGLTTHILALDPDDSYATDTVYSTASPTGIAGVLRRLRTAFLETQSREARISVASHTDRYTMLVSEVLRRSPNAATDPFTSIIAQFSSFASFQQTWSSQHRRGKALRSLDDAESARVHLSQFKLEAAEATLEKMLASDPHDAQSWVLLGKVHILLRKMGEAEINLECAADLRRRDHDIRFHLGLTRYFQRRLADAQVDFRAAYDLKPDDPLTLSFLGCTHGRVGDWDDAQRTVSKLAKRSPAMAYVAEKCLECASEARSWADASAPPKPPPTPWRLRLVLLAVGILAMFAEHFARHFRGKGYAVMILGTLAALALGFGQHFLGAAFKPPEVSSSPCWLQLEWMKDAHIVRRRRGIRRRKPEGGK